MQAAAFREDLEAAYVNVPPDRGDLRASYVDLLGAISRFTKFEAAQQAAIPQLPATPAVSFTFDEIAMGFLGTPPPSQQRHGETRADQRYCSLGVDNFTNTHVLSLSDEIHTGEPMACAFRSLSSIDDEFDLVQTSSVSEAQPATAASATAEMQPTGKDRDVDAAATTLAKMGLKPSRAKDVKQPAAEEGQSPDSVLRGMP